MRVRSLCLRVGVLVRVCRVFHAGVVRRLAKVCEGFDGVVFGCESRRMRGGVRVGLPCGRLSVGRLSVTVSAVQPSSVRKSE